MAVRWVSTHLFGGHMQNNQVDRRKPLSLVWAGGILAASMLVGLWLWQAGAVSMHPLLTTAALAVTGVLGVVWQFRARAQRRRHAAFNAYAEGEIARAHRANAPKGLAILSTRRRAPRDRSLSRGSQEAKNSYTRMSLQTHPRWQSRLTK